tara:strand:- start:731 stop:1306 length:576 start_codon:yes stop_codon:yes gene_type:complete
MQEYTKINKTGSIHIILGCMFSGKTTELLRNVKRYQSIGKKTMVLNYSLDERYGKDSVISHDALGVPAFMISDLNELFSDNKMKNEYEKSEYIFINEGQFFKDLKKFCERAVNIDHKIIYVCGLDGDYKQEKFGELIDLIPICESVVKLTALCKICGADASFTKRIVQSKETVLIGTGDIYQAVCRRHYFN